MGYFVLTEDLSDRILHTEQLLKRVFGQSLLFALIVQHSFTLSHPLIWNIKYWRESLRLFLLVLKKCDPAVTDKTLHAASLPFFPLEMKSTHSPLVR